MRISRLGSQDGAIVVFVAALAAVMFAASAFALDAGRWWVANRNLVTATDASGLAAASAYAVGDDGCALFAASYLTDNAPDATLADCDSEFENAVGYVTVVGQQEVPFIFGPLVGVPSATARSTTAVQVGYPLAAAGLRPIALCEHNEQIGDWANWNPDSGETFRIPLESGEGDCAGASGAGNFGWLHLGGSSGVGSVAGYIADGYQELYELAQPSQAGRTGMPASSLFVTALEGLVGQTILIAIFRPPVTGTGNNAVYNVVAFAAAEVVGAKLTGAADERYLEIRAARLLTTGTCCGPVPEFDTGERAMKICEVRLDAGLIATNCTNTD